MALSFVRWPSSVDFFVSPRGPYPPVAFYLRRADCSPRVMLEGARHAFGVLLTRPRIAEDAACAETASVCAFEATCGYLMQYPLPDSFAAVRRKRGCAGKCGYRIPVKSEDGEAHQFRGVPEKTKVSFRPRSPGTQSACQACVGTETWGRPV